MLLRLPVPLCTLFAMSVLLASATASEVELRSILNKHWEAMGGMRNWSKIESIQLNGTIEREGQLVDICIVKKRPNQIRATVTLPIPGDEENELQVIRAFDGKTAWTATRVAGAESLTQKELPPEAAAQLQADAGVMPPLIKLWQSNVPLSMGAVKQIGQEACFTIHADREDGNKTTFYLSSESFKLVARDEQSTSGKITRISLENYVEVSGIKIPKVEIINSSETGRSVVRAQSYKVGVGIYGDYFGLNEYAQSASRE